MCVMCYDKTQRIREISYYSNTFKYKFCMKIYISANNNGAYQHVNK